MNPLHMTLVLYSGTTANRDTMLIYHLFNTTIIDMKALWNKISGSIISLSYWLILYIKDSMVL